MSATARRNHLAGPATTADGTRIEAWTERRSGRGPLAVPVTWQVVVGRGTRECSAAGPAPTEAAAGRAARLALARLVREALETTHGL